MMRMTTRLQSSSRWISRRTYNCTNQSFRTLSRSIHSHESVASPGHKTEAETLGARGLGKSTSISPKDAAPTENPESELVELFNGKFFNASFLRDCCRCHECVDAFSTQKKFNTTDIPDNLEVRSFEHLEDQSVKIRWTNDILGYGPDHVSTYAPSFFESHSKTSALLRQRSNHIFPKMWDKTRITVGLQAYEFKDYMENEETLWSALHTLVYFGIVVIRQIPNKEHAIEDIAARIGRIRDTFYGRTWDVRSIPEAKNVAYTQEELTPHMDLLYMENPPGFQLLHCLKNTSEGGASTFVDSFEVAENLDLTQVASLKGFPVAYHYKNAGEHYYNEHPVIEMDYKVQKYSKGDFGRVNHRPVFKCVNYSPPFQANFPLYPGSQPNFQSKLADLRAFAKGVEDPKNMLEFKLKEGECVLFNNRRILHGRRAFDASGGERWLKGSYIDTDVVKSKWRVLNEKINQVVRKDDGTSLKVVPIHSPYFARSSRT